MLPGLAPLCTESLPELTSTNQSKDRFTVLAVHAYRVLAQHKLVYVAVHMSSATSAPFRLAPALPPG
jgi:hypothetical protein